jgi:formamidopyrimidine-DNA glycosylase
MPELPDIAAYMAALELRVMGLPLEGVRLASPFLLRTTTPALSEAAGRTVRELRRVGKRIAIGLDGDLWLVLQPRDFFPGRGEACLAPTSVRCRGRAARRAPRGPRHWGTNQTVAVLVLHLMIAGCLHWKPAHAALHGLVRENRTLKRALTDPRIVSGVGNAYSDEILHAARLSPLALTRKLTGEEWDRLFAATRGTLELWLKRLCAEARARFPEKVTAFREGMAVHGRYGEACRRCGAKVLRIRYADNETNYCAKCQTGGRVLADRGLSRLLGADWPRTLDELEELRRH